MSMPTTRFFSIARHSARVIMRTASADRSLEELLPDVLRLTRLWEGIVSRAADVAAPELLFAESDLVARALRDMGETAVEEIVVDTPEAHARAVAAAEAVAPALVERLRLHGEAEPLFHHYGIEEQIERIYARRVPLPGGGSVVFDQTEALLAVDVNSGRTRQDGLEETALQTNLEAAEAIARQLRLRDLGGVVAVDFIDMRDPAHAADLDQAFRAHLRRDRVHIRAAGLKEFSIFLLTRQRAGRPG